MDEERVQKDGPASDAQNREPEPEVPTPGDEALPSQEEEINPSKTPVADQPILAGPLAPPEQKHGLGYGFHLRIPKRFIVPIIAALAVLILAVVAIQYVSARNTLADINSQTSTQSYAQAYMDLTQFKNTLGPWFFPNAAGQIQKTLMDKANEQYQEGLRILSNDSTPDLSDAEKFFSNYELEFPYSPSIGKVEDLVSQLNQYSQLEAKVAQGVQLRDFINKVGDLVSIMQSYVSQVENIHSLADSAVNQQNLRSRQTLAAIWATQRGHYDAMVADINSAENFDLTNVLFTKDEYEEFKTFIASALVPAEGFYNLVIGNYSYDFAAVKSSWDTYNSLHGRVKTLLSNKQAFLQSSLDRLNTQEQETKDIRQHIKGFSSQAGSAT